MRRFIGLSTLLALFGVFAMSASIASAEELTEPRVVSEAELLQELEESESFSEAEVQQCFAYDLMCAWQGSEWGGQWSWWNNSDKGCHNHAGNPYLRSFWNATPYTVRIGGWGNLGPGYGLQMPVNQPITGELCWPV
jgi:hypothetical protein